MKDEEAMQWVVFKANFGNDSLLSDGLRCLVFARQ